MGLTARDVVKQLPVSIAAKDMLNEVRRRVNLVLLVEDSETGPHGKLTEEAIRAVRLGALVIELRRMLVRGDVTKADGEPALEALGELDNLMASVGLAAVVRRHSEGTEALATSVEDTARELIAALRRHGR
jgi:hypothetical protein